MKREDLFFDAFVVDGDKAWFFADNLNGLFELDLNTFQTYFLGFIPGEDILAQGLFYNMLKTGDRLVLLPANASVIAIYHLNTASFQLLEIDDPNMQFYGGTIYKNKVFMLGYNNPMIAVLDLQSEKIHYLNDCKEWIQGKKIFSDRMYFRKNYTVIDNSFYFVFCNFNAIAKLNMEIESVSFFEIKMEGNGFRSICSDGDAFWISEWNRASVIRWSEKDGVLGKYKYTEYVAQDFRTADIFYTDKLWLFPTIGENVLSFDRNGIGWRTEKMLLPYGSGADEHKHPWGNQAFPTTVLQGDVFYSFAGNTFEFLKILHKEGKVEAYHILADVYDAFKAYFEDSHETIFWIEKKDDSLNEYISTIKSIPRIFFSIKKKKIGKKIFLSIKNK